MMIPETAQCWSNHLGLWCVEPCWFSAAVTAYRDGLWPEGTGYRLQGTGYRGERERSGANSEPYALEPVTYTLSQGTAVIPIAGPLSKAGSWKFSGTSTVQTRQALRQASRDPEVQAILLLVDSPGGQVAGIDALAQEVQRTRQSKPVVAQIDELGASAAYWVASQADAIYASPTSEVGSIGTMAVLTDTSGQMDRLGIKVHVIATGAYKGLGVAGTPVSEAGLTYLQERVDAMNAHFLAAVGRGRSYSAEQLAQVSDGRVFLAAQAKRLGLIDGVQSLDETLASLPGSRRASPPAMPARRQRASLQLAVLRHRLAPMEG